MAGPTLGTAYVQVVASAKGIGGSLRNALSGEASAAGSQAGSTIAGKMKGAIMAAGIGVALVSGFKAALSETGELQQSYIGGLDTLYGDAADKAREYAQAAQEAGVSQKTFSEQAVSFGAALKQAYGGDASKALEAANTAILDMTDNAAKMGTPLQSIQDAYQGFAKQNYTMLDNLKLGYGGTKTEMERLLADAEKISGVHYDISNLGDIYSAIHVIQGELGLTGVAATEARDTLTGSAGAMAAAWQNLLGNLGLGENVKESMAAFTESLSTYLFDNLFPTIGTIIQGLPTAISTFIQTGLPQLSAAGMTLVTSLAKGAQEELPNMIKTVLTSLGTMSGQFTKYASKFIDVGLKLIQSIAKGIIANIPTFIQTIPTIITNLANVINQNAPKILAVGFDIIKSLAVGLIKAIPVLIQSIPDILKAFVAAFEAFNWLNLGKVIIGGISKGISALIPHIKSAMGKVKNFMLSPLNTVKNFVGRFVSGVKSTFNFSSLASKAKSMFTSIKDKMLSPLKTAKEKIKGIIDKIKGLFPFNVGKIFTGWIPKIKLWSKKNKDKAETNSSTSRVPFAKAMSQPYMFKQPTEFYAGERGDEMLYGRKALMRDIAEASGNGGDIIINLNYDASEDATDMLRDITRNIQRYKMAGVF